MKIICIIILSIVFNIPHLYITAENGRSCIPFGNAIQTVVGQFYYSISLIVNFALPFVLLLVMNCFIIHTIRQRSKHNLSRSVTSGQGQGGKIKHSEMQMFVILLLVTFGFLILMTPSYVLFVYVTAQLGETPASDWQSLQRLFARGRLANAAVQAMACTRVTVQG